MPPPIKGTYALISLGCPKSLVDSECMAGLLKAAGYQLAQQPEGADFVLVNTCGFLRSARKEALDTIHEMIRLKRKGLLRGIIVAGCLVQRERESLVRRCQGIDQIVGVFARDEIVKAAERVVARAGVVESWFDGPSDRPLCDADRLRLTLPHVAYLKISEGCDRRCTFCTIPAIRGKHSSKPIEQVLDEARRLASEGAREVILVAQDTTYYGVDLYGEPRLAQLLAGLEQIPGIEWIRLMYLYPKHLTDELIEVVASGRKVLRYLDLPLQHIDDSILRAMNRGVTRAETERLVDRLRDRIEGLVLRTTLMTGFPGETEQQFEELLGFVRQRRFERLGVFAYSREEGTPSDRMSGHLPGAVAQARRQRLLALQQQIAFAWTESLVGRQLEVIIDRALAEQSDAFVGRSYADAPEIDGVVYVTGQGLKPGQIVPCEIVAAQGYDAIGVAVGPDVRGPEGLAAMSGE